MRYAALTQRIAGEGADAWNIHYRAENLRRQGRDILMLTVGDPDFATPQPVVEAAIASLRAGHTHYSAVNGDAALREAIARQHSRQCGVPTPAQDVVVLAGAQCALFAVAQCLFDPGDEVIVAEPMYVTYPALLGACGAEVVALKTDPQDGFRLDPQALAALITPRTRAILVNSPNNPTGASLPRASWERLAELCVAHDLWLVVDEVYCALLYDGVHTHPAGLPGMAGRCVTINSLSKSHAMAGWRVGWVVGPPALARHLTHLALCMLYGLPDFVQHAAQVALESALPELEQMRQTYRDRRDRVCACLAGCPGINVHTPAGGMFVMLDIRQTGLSACAFAERLLERYGVAVLAADAFGPSAAGHLRLGLVLDSAQLELACQRIARCAVEVLEAQPSAQ